MAEILIKAVSVSHSDPIVDQRGCYKLGMPVVVMPDGHEWGSEEQLPKFVVIKIPTISEAQVEKYIKPWTTADAVPVTIQRRRWRIRWAALPVAAQDILRTTGQLIIKAGSYAGPFDYTWTQVKAFFRNHETGLDETADLT